MVTCSVAKSCPTLWPRELQHARLPCLSLSLEFAQTHVHWVADAIQLSHLCCPILLLPSVFPSIRVFSNDLALHIRKAKYWSFIFSISLPMNIQDWFPLGLPGLISLQSKGLSRVLSSTTIQKHHLFRAQSSFGLTLTYVHDYWKIHSFHRMDLYRQGDVFELHILLSIFLFSSQTSLPRDLDGQFSFLIMHVFTGGLLLIFFKYFSFAFTTWPTVWCERPGFWPVLAFDMSFSNDLLFLPLNL